MSRIHRKRNFNNDKEGESVSALPSDFTFRGIKSTWTQFENNVQGFIQDDSKNGGTKAVKFLFENDWDTPAWETRVVPPPLVDDGDDDFRALNRDRNEEIDRIEKHNEKINKVETLCMAAIRNYCSEPLRRALLQFRGDPIHSWNYLRQTYGPESKGVQDIPARLANLLTTVMNSEETFHEFLIDFEESEKDCKITDEVKLGILQFNKKKFNSYQIG